MRSKPFALLLAAAALCMLCAACSASSAAAPDTTEIDDQDEKDIYPEQLRNTSYVDTTGFLRLVDDSIGTVDPQCTTEYYTVALNVFDRLVELRGNEDGTARIEPSLAESWERSADGLTYRFHLHEGVTFSNGSPLTASDVRYTFERLLTYPKSVNQDLALCILGAEELRRGEADSLSGFRELDELTFEITLAYPYAPFLATLSSPGASILDEESTERADLLFGVHAQSTIGTGPFIFRKWSVGSEMIFLPNENCWSGAPSCPGIVVTTMRDAESQRLMFENGELDILDLDNLGGEAEYFLHSEQYHDRICSGLRVGLKYIALNESVPPLDDVRVRRALQLALDRQVMLNAVYGGHGNLENGIFPHGLSAYNPELDEIPYDPEEAARLLEEAGVGDGFDLPISISIDASATNREVAEFAAFMWQQIGVNAEIVELDETEYMAKRRAGRLACYCHGWTADYDDPDNFIFTFFGNRENTVSRSLCYGDEAVIERVAKARSILNDAERMAEYHALEQKIVQEDAAWIPLFSHEHFFVVSERTEGFRVPWNGWSMGMYREITLNDQKGG